jgi:SnoaL-like domain
MTPGELAVRATLRELSERYAAACDRRDGDAYAAVFTADGRMRVFNPHPAAEARVEIVGRERLAEIPLALKKYTRTFHLLGNATYDVGADEATGEVYCLAHHLTVDGHGGTDYVMFIRYQDDYVRPGPGEHWYIADRRLLVDWTEVRAANPAGR